MDDAAPILSMAGVGFFGMLFIGFLAGWIAERTMNRDHGVLTNILVGIAGSFVGGTAASLLGFQWYGFVGNLVVATIGAVAILWFFGKREQTQHHTNRNRQNPSEKSSNQQGSQGFEDENQPPMYHSNDEKN